ncbi:MAG: endonuclease MutS2 [Angelakisella sp.]|jgi:DNA mismatch repair protein MutS2|nr:endonuclease MutS2 [Angelakisella sp.]MCI9529747.1 endonuclease MutS2 [Angelakisella sp.]
MKNKHYIALELDKVLELLAAKTTSAASAARARDLLPYSDWRDVRRAVSQTAEINSLSVRFGTPGLGGIRDCGAELHRAQVGGRLSIPELLSVCRVLRTIRSVKDWRRQAEEPTGCDHLFGALTPNRALEEEIDRCVLNDEELQDTASAELASIRRKIRKAQLSIRERLDSIIKSPQYAQVLQEPIVTIRDGRFVVPVKAERKGELRGLVHDTSGSGATVFVEPMAVVDANNEIRILRGEEQEEVDRILLELSGRVGEMGEQIAESFDALVELDVLFAKSRLADAMGASVPEIRQDRLLRLNKARHPLIPRERVVPVDITLGDGFDTLVITGPNTGGKTVALKTLGLLTLMAACGLLLPCGDGSCVPVFDRVLADIGDEQSIEQSLSTFSAHITNIISILEWTGPRSLVLTDELGAGTDPVEGAALAVSILEALRRKGALVAATTHYAEIKMYALTTPGVENGSCEFNVETLSPTYRLLIGVPGRSNAFAISARLGLPEEVIDRAKELVSSENTRFEDVVSDLERTRQELEKEQQAAASRRQQMDSLKAEMEEERQRLYARLDQEAQQARQQAQTMVERVKSQTDLLLNELEELKKQQDKEEFSQKLSQLRAGYKGRIEHLRDMADPVAQRRGEAYTLPRKLRSGDTVLLTGLNLEGTVLSGPDSSGCYMVQAGILKSKVKEEELRLVDTKDRKVTVNGRRRATSTESRVNREARTEIDIRGMDTIDGIATVDRFLDQAALMGMGTVTIIHGKGTGALRTAIQNHLRKLKSIKSFRPGMYGEGEAGVTVVELK